MPATNSGSPGSLEAENARLRGDLATISRRINHDLRSPLMAIRVACDAVAEMDKAGEEPREPYLRSISESAREIEILAERMRLLARASVEPSEREKVAMERAVWVALQRLDSLISERIAAVAQPASWPTVTGVASWLESVWWNLLDNALRHGGAEPKIELGWRKEGDGCLFWTDDRGPGVPEGKVGMLFEPFESLHRTNAPRGLGLPIVQRLVALQGGRCGYEPRQGGGSRFYFTLPEKGSCGVK